MIVYRCSLRKWAHDLRGTGAYLYGGRWNSPGLPAIYTAENNLLAALEVAIRVPLTKISEEYVMTPIRIPDEIDVYQPRLPGNWRSNLTITRTRGDSFLREKKYLLMKVPSALMSHTFNYVINPEHSAIADVKSGKSHGLIFDPRLIQLMRK